MARSKMKQLSDIAVPSQVIHSLSSSSLQNLILSPKKSSRSRNRLFSLTISPRFFLLFLFLFALVGTLQIGFRLDPLLPFSPMPCSTIGQGTTAAAVVRNPRGEVPLKGEEEGGFAGERGGGGFSARGRGGGGVPPEGEEEVKVFRRRKRRREGSTGERGEGGFRWRERRRGVSPEGEEGGFHWRERRGGAVGLESKRKNKKKGMGGF